MCTRRLRTPRDDCAFRVQRFSRVNLTDDPGNANFSSPIRMHYIRMIKYYYVWLRIQYGKLRTNTDCHKCTSVGNPASSSWLCDLGIIAQIRTVVYCKSNVQTFNFMGWSLDIYYAFGHVFALHSMESFKHLKMTLRGVCCPYLEGTGTYHFIGQWFDRLILAWTLT